MFVRRGFQVLYYTFLVGVDKNLRVKNNLLKCCISFFRTSWYARIISFLILLTPAIEIKTKLVLMAKYFFN